MQIKATFRCPICQHDKAIKPTNDNDRPFIVCANCHTDLISVEDFNDEMRRVGREIAVSLMRGEADNAEFAHPALIRSRD